MPVGTEGRFVTAKSKKTHKPPPDPRSVVSAVGPANNRMVRCHVRGRFSDYRQ
jgi:hypothetical protein